MICSNRIFYFYDDSQNFNKRQKTLQLVLNLWSILQLEGAKQ